jgi:arginyl-tRNA synthetase
MLNISANKTVVFSWDRVLNFDLNSAPFIQYAHARACSILRKADFKWKMPSDHVLKHELERRLVLRLSRFPEVVIEAAETLQPEMVTAYANNLATEFNSFYNELPVLKAESDESRKARLAMVDSVRQVLSNSLSLLGITAPSRM